ncbi:DUF6207 family protein [Streptomyces sp. NPDC085639]|uniref:DUF6207 family protein n=1 Tax=Streptomyces sp. NPDC085639 TaxID=3365734 RepID=UPI0037D6711B
MKPIDAQYIAEPGLVVLDITGGDEDTVQAVVAALEERWAASGVVQVHRDTGEPGCGPGSTPTSCARDGTARGRRALDKPLAARERQAAEWLSRARVLCPVRSGQVVRSH